MGGNACVIKKKMCNPPLLALMSVPESIIEGIENGSITRDQLEAPWFETYIWRCVRIDIVAARQYEEANEYYFANVLRAQNGEPPVPAPWKQQSTPYHQKQNQDFMQEYISQGVPKTSRDVKDVTSVLAAIDAKLESLNPVQRGVVFEILGDMFNSLSRVDAMIKEKH